MNPQGEVPWTSEHIEWLVDTGERLTTADDKEVEVWEFRHQPDEAVLSAWAKHFRNHYCLDTEIDFFRGPHSRADYLTCIKFPSSSGGLGPSIRAGDFGEILVADYLQWVLKCWVPRIRWSSKIIRNESLKGSDVIGFRFHEEKSEDCSQDTLFIFESKTKFSNSTDNRLQTTINDSARNNDSRIAESLNFIKQRLFEKNKIEQAEKIGRFQKSVDMPYKEIHGAVAVVSDEYYDAEEEGISSASCSDIPEYDNLALLIIKGPTMMKLVHDLYQRAADEA